MIFLNVTYGDFQSRKYAKQLCLMLLLSLNEVTETFFFLSRSKNTTDQPIGDNTNEHEFANVGRVNSAILDHYHFEAQRERFQRFQRFSRSIRERRPFN